MFDKKLILLLIVLFGSIYSCRAQSELDILSLEEINRKLENPLTDLWSLTFQENFYILAGDFSESEIRVLKNQLQENH